MWLEEILQDKDDEVNDCSEKQTNTANPCEDFVS